MIHIDLHVHTSFGSACAELHHPDTIPDAMEKRNLHGVVITEHNSLWPDQMIRSLNLRLPPGRRIYAGMEVSTSCCHVVVIGLDHSGLIYPGMPPELLCELAADQLAATILVHPYQSSNGFDPDKESLPGFHCMEVASTMTRGDIRTRTLALCKTIKAYPVAGSDAHCSDNLGMTFTGFPWLPADEKELALMIRQGLGIAMTRENNGEGLIVC